jgi:hypothetical protein
VLLAVAVVALVEAAILAVLAEAVAVARVEIAILVREQMEQPIQAAVVEVQAVMEVAHQVVQV